MLKETELFFAEIVREDRSVLDLIDGRYTYLNDRLSWHYNITDTVGTRGTAKPAKSGGQKIRGPNFVRVELPEGGDRGGILTHASVLTVTSNPTRTSPVKRGRWVLEQILGTPPPAPAARRAGAGRERQGAADRLAAAAHGAAPQEPQLRQLSRAHGPHRLRVREL